MNDRSTGRSRRLACGLALLLGSLVVLGAPAYATEAGRRLPAPALVEPRPAGGLETAVLAGGCFWGVQGVFQHVRGVTRAVSGYAGGRAEDARYDAVSSGRTGHAEAVSVTYDPAIVTYGEILRIFFSVALDPTEVNRQGPDDGPQYRSAVFPQSDAQAEVARAYIAQLDAAKLYRAPIATQLEQAEFRPAEAEHQDFLARHPSHPYIVVNDLPKIHDLKRFFPERFVPVPVLVTATR